MKFLVIAATACSMGSITAASASAHRDSSAMSEGEIRVLAESKGVHLADYWAVDGENIMKDGKVQAWRIDLASTPQSSDSNICWTIVTRLFDYSEQCRENNCAGSLSRPDKIKLRFALEKPSNASCIATRFPGNYFYVGARVDEHLVPKILKVYADFAASGIGCQKIERIDKTRNPETKVYTVFALCDGPSIGDEISVDVDADAGSVDSSSFKWIAKD